MNKYPPTNIRTLRHILDLTQSEFAQAVGVSHDAVVSWENGRNPLSKSFARRISRATGADELSLMKQGPLWVAYSQPKKTFTREDYDHHRKHFWGNSDQASAAREAGRCTDALELLFRAAARAGAAGKTLPLPAVVDSFVQWCRQTEEDFGLLQHIDAELETRKHPVPLTKTYRQWREEAVKQPSVARTYGFRDDPKKADQESLTLTAEMFPVWAPGWNMRRGKR